MTATGQYATYHASKRATTALQPMIESRALAGVVAVTADRTQVLDLQSLGWADIASGAPMRPDTLFWIASQTKPMTAAALMMLVDERKLSLDDPVAQHLPEFEALWVQVESTPDRLTLERPRHPITVREILSHTSGMPFASALERPTLDGLPLRVATGSYAMTPLQTEPGTAYAYSNAGINAAGRLIEVLNGEPYEAFLQRRLFDPLGMTDTTFWPSPPQQERLAKSYRPNAAETDIEETPISQLRYPLEDRARCPVPAGGLFSTAADVVRFCQMLLNGGQLDGRRLLSEEAVRQMTRKQTGAEVPDEYGLGLSVSAEGYGHGGAHATGMMIDPRNDRIYVWMVQHAGFLRDGGEGFSRYKEAINADLGT